MESMLWERVGELADQAPQISDLRHHKLHLLAAARLRQRGDDVPAELRDAERHQAAISLGGPPMLRRIREATDEPIIVMKGLAVAERWPGTRLRPWTDMDLFVRDGEAVQAALLRAGFVEVGEPEDYEDSHHLRPVAYPGFPFAVEIHRRPKWPNHQPPPFDEVLEAATPAFSVPDVFAPSPAHHAVLLAGHAWAHDPLGSIGPLADVAAMMLAAGDETAAAVSRAWGVSRLWAATAWAADRLLLSPQLQSSRTPIWQRHLYEARERTVFEGHVERLAGPKAASTPAAAPLAVARAVSEILRPWPGERWGSKLARSRLSLRHASVRESEHKEALFGPRRG